MPKSDKFQGVMHSIIENLLTDITAGHGDESIAIPVANQNTNDFVNDCINELAQFWGGNEEITKYELFGSILAYCANNDTVIANIADTMVDNYPENTAKLTNESIFAVVNQFCGASTPAQPTVETVPVATTEPIVEPTLFDPYADTPMDDIYEDIVVQPEQKDTKKSKDSFAPVEQKNTNTGKSGAKQAKIEAYNSMVAAKKAMAEERAMVNSH